MNNSIKVYITSNYSVVLCDNDINSITESVREILYSMPQMLQLFSLMVCDLWLAPKR